MGFTLQFISTRSRIADKCLVRLGFCILWVTDASRFLLIVKTIKIIYRKIHIHTVLYTTQTKHEYI
jgi:hypothetical protein